MPVERFWTPATVVTVVRTAASAALTLAAAREGSLTLLLVGLVVYWLGDVVDGGLARLLNCETRTGALVDIFSDRLNAALFYAGLCWLEPTFAVPVGVYLFQFMVIDTLLSISFMAWPVLSPNYFYVVDRRIWSWNWSKPAKFVNSAIFAVLLLTTDSVVLGTVFAGALLLLKSLSLRRLLSLGLPVPAWPAGRQDSPRRPAPATEPH